MAIFTRMKDKKNKQPTSPTQTVYLLTFFVQMSVFSEGFELGSTSTAILLVQSVAQMQVTPYWKQLIMAGSLPSATVFSLIGAWVSDRFGRKKCVICSCLSFLLGAIITALANSREVLLIGRLITGAGVGLYASSSSVYVAECSPRHLRGCLVGISEPLFAIGILTADLVSVAFRNDAINGWRYIWGFQGIFSCVQFFGLLFLPESPSWLLQESRKIEVKKSLTRLRNSDDVSEEMWEMEASLNKVRTSIKRSGGGNLFLRMLKSKSVRWALIVGCGLHIFAEFSGVHTIIYYSGIIIQMSGIGDLSSVLFNNVMVNTVNLIFAIIGMWLVDRVGRKLLLIISLIGLALSGFCLGTTFLFSKIYSPRVNNTDISFKGLCSTYRQCDDCIRNPGCGFCYNDQLVIMDGACLPVSDTSLLISKLGACNSSSTLLKYSMKWADNYCPVSFSWIALVGLTAYLIFYAIGMGPIPWTVNAEIYPLWARSTGNGIACVMSFISNFLMTASFLSFIEFIHNYGVFYLMASVALIGAVFCFFFLPETKNKSLEEIEVLFASDKQSI